MPRYFDDWKPYVSVGARRAAAARELIALRKNGRATSPVQIDGRTIATTFWGKAWCDNLERYSDFANRLPRGRTYVRHGAVVDLQIQGGTVTALVSGSDLYQVRIAVKAVPRARWQGICRDCTGIDSLVELLQGRLSEQVMGRICEPRSGLFPEPRDLTFACSCPDWASMCKHVAAALYGVGARLDERPELLFLLREVNQEDLIADTGSRLRPRAAARAAGKVLESSDLSEMFGIELEPAAATRAPATRPAKTSNRKSTAASMKRPAAAPPTPTAKGPVRPGRASSERAKTAAPGARRPKASPPPRLSAKEVGAIGKRMQQYWQERRRQERRRARAARAAAAAKPVESARSKPARPGNGSAAARQAVSERMKRYWEKRRRRNR